MRSCRSRSCPENHALAIAIMSYNGKVDFGLLADYDAMPDLEDFGGMLEDSLAELLEAASAAASSPEPEPEPEPERQAAAD